MQDLFKLYDTVASFNNGLRLEIYHSDAMNWCVTIHSNDGRKIADIENSERTSAFSKAYEELRNWAIKNGDIIND